MFFPNNLDVSGNKKLLVVSFIFLRVFSTPKFPRIPSTLKLLLVTVCIASETPSSKATPLALASGTSTFWSIAASNTVGNTLSSVLPISLAPTNIDWSTRLIRVCVITSWYDFIRSRTVKSLKSPEHGIIKDNLFASNSTSTTLGCNIGILCNSLTNAALPVTSANTGTLTFGCSMVTFLQSFMTALSVNVFWIIWLDISSGIRPLCFWANSIFFSSAIFFTSYLLSVNPKIFLVLPFDFPLISVLRPAPGG